MRETANERLVREIARDVALDATRRIHARLREAEAEPLVDRLYEAEWGADGKEWPRTALPAEKWIPYLRDDLKCAEAEFAACSR